MRKAQEQAAVALCLFVQMNVRIKTRFNSADISVTAREVPHLSLMETKQTNKLHRGVRVLERGRVSELVKRSKSK